MTYPVSNQEAVDNLVERCGKTEDSKGFRESWKLADQLEELADRMIALPAGDEAIERIHPDATLLRNAAKELRNLYISSKLMLAVTELAEAMEALRDHGVENIEDSNFDEELVDSHIRLFALANLLGYDNQGEAMLKKMGVNTNRPYMHNRQL